MYPALCETGPQKILSDRCHHFYVLSCFVTSKLEAKLTLEQISHCSIKKYVRRKVEILGYMHTKATTHIHRKSRV